MFELELIQKKCAEDLSKKSRIFNMGAGKGKTAIALQAAFLAGYDKNIIVAKPQQINSTWVDHIKEMNWLPQDYQVIKTKKDVYEGKYWTIISIDNAYQYFRSMTKQFGTVIIDEVHRTTNMPVKGNRADGKYFKGAEFLSKHCKLFLGFTGTPIRIGHQDIFSYLVFLKHPISFIKNHKTGRKNVAPAKELFLQKYCGAIRISVPGKAFFSTFWKPTQDQYHNELKEHLIDYILTIPNKDIQDTKLPQNTILTEEVILTTIQRENYEKSLETYNEKLRKRLDPADFFDKMIRNKESKLPETIAMQTELTKAKIDHAVKLVKKYINKGHRINLFVDYVESRLLLHKLLKAENIKCRLHQKAVDIELWKKEKENIFLTSRLLGGEGIDLRTGTVSIFLDGHWTYAAMLQLFARNSRKGQTRETTNIVLVAKDTIDDRKSELQESRQKSMLKLGLEI